MIELEVGILDLVTFGSRLMGNLAKRFGFIAENPTT